MGRTAVEFLYFGGSYAEFSYCFGFHYHIKSLGNKIWKSDCETQFGKKNCESDSSRCVISYVAACDILCRGLGLGLGNCVLLTRGASKWCHPGAGDDIIAIWDGVVVIY